MLLLVLRPLDGLVLVGLVIYRSRLLEVGLVRSRNVLMLLILRWRRHMLGHLRCRLLWHLLFHRRGRRMRPRLDRRCCLRILQLLLRLLYADAGRLIGVLRLLAEIRSRQWRLRLAPTACDILLMVETGYLLTLLACVARICELRLLLRLRALNLSLSLLRSILVLLYRGLSQRLRRKLLLRSRILDLIWI